MLAEAFCRFVADSGFPCVGAKAALGRDQIDFAYARDIRSNWDDTTLARQLSAFANGYKKAPKMFRSFVILFEADGAMPELDFERHLWQRIQSLSDKDVCAGERCDPRVASDPGHKQFALSFCGEAFFVVGLHPGASRPARRFSRAALVFNLHDQFTRLRAEGKYESMRKTIIDRDVQLAGSVNPMLARHGDTSEARQYSGRAVGEGWQCPYRRHAVVGKAS